MSKCVTGASSQLGCVVRWLMQLRASWTIAFWGPDTKDTGSILTGDWWTVHEEKMALLAPLMHPGFV